MKQLLSGLIVIVLGFAPIVPVQAAPYAVNTPEVRELAGTIDRLLKAHTEKDINLLMAQFHPQARALWSNGKVMRSKLELRAVYQESFLHYRNFKGSWLPEHADIEGDTAWIHGETSFSTDSIETQQTIHLTVRSTFVLRKSGNRWLILWEHSSHRRSD